MSSWKKLLAKQPIPPSISEQPIQCGDGAIDPDRFRWQASSAAKDALTRALGTGDLSAFRKSLGKLLCQAYYPTTQGRSKALGVNPIACKVPKGRGFKVRWNYPGCGKSGGLRLGILALCESARIIIACAIRRNEDPSEDQLEKAFSDASNSAKTV
jgi:hypothetical protein